MGPYYIEEWCRLFGYGSCRSMPLLDSFIFWGGTAAAVIGAFLVFVGKVTDRL